MWKDLTKIWYDTKWEVLNFSKPEIEVFSTDLSEPNIPTWNTSNDLRHLYPPFRQTIINLLADLERVKANLYVFEARRSFKRQEYLYEQGRVRKYDASDNQLRIVTNSPAGTSLHNYGLAVDLVFDKDEFKSGMQWTWDGDYQILGDCVSKYSDIEWAGNWRRFREYPHVQLKLHYPISFIQRLYKEAGGKEKGIKAVWDALDVVSGKRQSDFKEDV